MTSPISFLIKIISPLNSENRYFNSLIRLYSWTGDLNNKYEEVEITSICGVLNRKCLKIYLLSLLFRGWVWRARTYIRIQLIRPRSMNGRIASNFAFHFSCKSILFESAQTNKQTNNSNTQKYLNKKRKKDFKKNGASY